MRNLKCTMSYKGTAYHGFQSQNNAVAIQDILEDRLSYLTHSTVKVNGCSRTDTGVHANEFCFNFKTEHPIPCNNIVRGVNSLLPDDIAVHTCEEADEDFHARFSCIGKEYVYLLLNSPTKNPFYSDLALHYPYKFDYKLLDASAKAFEGTHDFTSFCGTSNIKENCVRTIEYFNVKKDDELVRFTVKGDGFLYNMVRIMVGTLIFINEGKLSPDSIDEIIEKKDRNIAGKTAAPHGLYLNSVFY